MFKPKLSLQVFSAAIARSISAANEMLEVDHKIAVQRFKGDQFGMVMPPPPPLMIKHVKVKFSGNASKSGQDKESGDVFIDLGRPDGNFSAELEFEPFSDEMLKAVKHSGGGNMPFAAKPAQPILPHPALERPVAEEPRQAFAPAPTSETEWQPNSGYGPYDTSDTPRPFVTGVQEG